MEDEISIHFFDEKLQEDFELTNYIEQSQELALQANRFRIFYQGKYDLHKNRFTACKALARWKDNTKGYISTPRPSSMSLIETVSSSSWISSSSRRSFRTSRKLSEKAVKSFRSASISPGFTSMTRISS